MFTYVACLTVAGVELQLPQEPHGQKSPECFISDSVQQSLLPLNVKAEKGLQRMRDRKSAQLLELGSRVALPCLSFLKGKTVSTYLTPKGFGEDKMR